MYALGLLSTSFTMYFASQEGLKEWGCLHLHIWVVEYCGRENVTLACKLDQLNLHHRAYKLAVMVLCS